MSLLGGCMPRTAASDIASKVVGGEIRQTRLTIGMSQAALARRLSVSAAYVASVEAGRSNLTVGQLMNFASAMQVGLEIRFPVAVEEDFELVETAPTFT